MWYSQERKISIREISRTGGFITADNHRKTACKLNAEEKLCWLKEKKVREVLKRTPAEGRVDTAPAPFSITLTSPHTLMVICGNKPACSDIA
jgi:hypothetical protein